MPVVGCVNANTATASTQSKIGCRWRTFSTNCSSRAHCTVSNALLAPTTVVPSLLSFSADRRKLQSLGSMFDCILVHVKALAARPATFSNGLCRIQPRPKGSSSFRMVYDDCLGD